MAKNKLSDLNNHLFAQLERLSDESISESELKQEMNRAKAVNGVAKNIIDNARTVLEGSKMSYGTLQGNQELPEVFGVQKNKK